MKLAIVDTELSLTIEVSRRWKKFNWL